MKLVIDLGNTFQKLAVYSDDNLMFLKSQEQIDVDLLSNIFIHYPVSTAILSSVINHDKEIEAVLNRHGRYIILDDKTPIPIVNKYKSPETLGKDRLAAAVAGNYMYPSKPVLVVDTGTCIKYDFINSENEYLGGSISPGLRMRFKALNAYTGKLPFVELIEFNALIGKNTAESLLSGVITGTLAEIDGIISRYRENYPEIQVVLSGGDAEYLVGKLKNKIFAVSNIVLFGLKIILDYNDHQKTL